MKLITKEVEATLPKLYTNENVPTAKQLAVLKVFDPSGRFTFYATEGSRNEDGDMVLFGYCVSALGPDCDELGYASVRELEATKGRFGLGMERDRYFTPKTLGELVPGLEK